MAKKKEEGPRSLATPSARDTEGSASGKISAAVALAARAKALAMIAGTYQAPKPTKANRSTRFMPRVSPRPADIAVRSKTGQRIGPR